MRYAYCRVWLSGLVVALLIHVPSVLYAEAPSKSRDPGGWMAAKWGMGETQILAGFPDQAKKLTRPEEYGGGSFASVVIDSMAIGGITYRVHFIFQLSDSTLEAVNIAPIDESPGIAAVAYDHLEEALTKKYGAPDYRRDGENARVTSRMVRKELAWRLTITEISLSYMKDSIMTMTRLVYRPVQALKETDEKL